MLDDDIQELLLEAEALDTTWVDYHENIVGFRKRLRELLEELNSKRHDVPPPWQFP